MPVLVRFLSVAPIYIRLGAITEPSDLRPIVMDILTLHRLHFAFTIVYHYIFPQITMGLALLIFVLKTMGVRGDEAANRAVRFWAKILGVTFVMGVITGIPMEFQFGTNWS
ncbi:MAG: cytochrome ubiquinol oxidase subunit I, partial [Rhodothermales bacterium]